MREIKFRGKRFDDGTWIYGSYTHCHDVDRRPSMIPFGANFFVSVDPDTVGQYTGLKDKNGKEIYEGDILFHSAECGTLSVQAYGFERKWGKGEKFIVSYLDCGLILRHISAYGNSGYGIPNCIINGWSIVDAYQFWNLQRGFEVIGNIHEELELIKINNN